MTVSNSIITTTANSLLQSIGVKRMPIILSLGYEKEWIKPSKHLSEVLGKLKQFIPEKMNAYPVSDLVNTLVENNILMISPIEEKLQNEEQQPTREINPHHHWHKVKHPPNGSWGESREKVFQFSSKEFKYAEYNCIIKKVLYIW